MSKVKHHALAHSSALGESANTKNKKYFAKYKEPLAPLPNLIEGQLNSFKWLVKAGLKEVFDEYVTNKFYNYQSKKY